MPYAVEYWPQTTDVKQTAWTPQESEVPEGWVYWPSDDPPQPVPETPTQEQLLASAAAERDRLLTYATLRINPLQDAYDLGEATQSEIDLLTKWRQYRVAVNRISNMPGYPHSISWPTEPS